MANFNNPDWISLPFEELERFDLICSICRNVFSDPVQTDNDPQDPCGHVFCKSCITQWLQSNSECPNCRAPLRIDQLRINKHAQRQIQRLPAICHIRPKLCTTKGELGKSQEWWNHHDKVCEFKSIPCPLCSKPYQRGKIKKHVVEKCLAAFKECKLGCGKPVRRKDLNIHAKRCFSRLVECGQCSELHPEKKLGDHIKQTCPKTKIQCIFNSLGCSYSHARDDKVGQQNHMETNSKQHLALATRKLIDLGQIAKNNIDQRENEEVLHLFWSFTPGDAREVIQSHVLAKGFGGDWGLSFGYKNASKEDLPLFICNFDRIPVRISYSLSLRDPATGKILKTLEGKYGPEWNAKGVGYYLGFYRTECPLLDEINILLVSASIKVAL